MSKLPDFLICGFQKCGTTALSHNLNQHSRIKIPRTGHPKAKLSHGKEFNFFSSQQIETSTTTEGIEWYKSHFQKDEFTWGEASPSYSVYVPEVLQIMQKYLTDTKFVFSIRNPINRAFSAYNHYMQLLESNIKFGNWDPSKSFIEIVESNKYLFTLSYTNALFQYEKTFCREKIHIAIQEKIDSDDYQEEYNKLFDFLNLKYETVNNNKIHSRDYIREISKNEIEFLKELYREEVDELFNWMGREVSEWKEFC